jgi:hypothetical protein
MTAMMDDPTPPRGQTLTGQDAGEVEDNQQQRREEPNAEDEDRSKEEGWISINRDDVLDILWGEPQQQFQANRQNRIGE